MDFRIEIMQRPVVLVVDADDDTRAILGGALGHAGYSVIDTGDGRKGLELAARHRPDLIIGDFPMDVPGHSPFIAALREIPGSEDTPLIVFTARVLPDELEAARNLGQALVLKPAEPFVVVREVDRLLGAGED